MSWMDALTPTEAAENIPAAPESTEQQEPATPAAPEIPAATEPAAESQSLPPNTPPPAVTPDANAPAAPVDFATILDEMSGGTIKTADQLKALFPKILDYDQLKADRDNLAAEMAQAPKFADDEVRILNELKQGGATKEQLNAFKKINDYGSISEMPDRDAIVANMVMLKGTKPSTAELMVDKQFKIGEEDLDETDRAILDEQLRVSAIDAKKELEKFKATVSSPNQVPPEELQLQQQAQLLAHQNKVKPFVRDVVAGIPHLGSINLSGKDGADAIMYDIPFDADAKVKFEQALDNFYMDGLTPVTPENTLAALKYAKAEYWAENGERLLREAYSKAVNTTTEFLVNKYENRSGLKPTPERTGAEVLSDAAQTAKFMQDKVNRVGQ